MARGGERIRWLGDPMSRRIEVYRMHLRKQLAVVMAAYANTMEDYMKENAPWSDRTGDARSGLGARYEGKVLIHTIVLFHGVEYGYWLEVIQAGRYSIIAPTMEVMGRELMEDLHQINQGRHR